MNKYIFFLFICIVSCTKTESNKNKKINEIDMKIKIYHALEIAQKDAEKSYKDLSIFKVTILLKNENWQIDYDLKDEHLQGGGPHYIISEKTGEIISKRYEQ